MKRLALIFVFLAGLAHAVEPDEILSDPVLEDRAREISKGLRCPVCLNESIDESNADLSRELRILLRERLVAGDTDDEAVNFIVSRYGEFVLLKPSSEGANLILWAAPLVMLLGALFLGWATIRKRRAPDIGLSEEEQARLEALLKE